MAKGKNEEEADNGSDRDIVRIGERISNLLALLLVTGKPRAEQIALLNGAGFSAAEIGRLIGTTPNTVSVTLYQLKRGKPRSK